MKFIPPMNCKTLPEDYVFEHLENVVETKFDGHRLETAVSRRETIAWARSGLIRELPPHLVAELRHLPPGVYDGELMGEGDKSYNVTEVASADKRRIVLFDVLVRNDIDVMSQEWTYRRARLESAYSTAFGRSGGEFVHLSKPALISTRAEFQRKLDRIKADGGEGVIVKPVRGIYLPGRRTHHFMKAKRLESKVLTLIGFEKGKGSIINRGLFARVRLRDSDGCECTVKTLNDDELAKFEAAFKPGMLIEQHPAIGRQLRIEFHERTPAGKYREPRWDRWEDE